MDFVRASVSGGIAEVSLQRGKVNALDEQVVGELAACFAELGGDPGAGAVILTGTGKFFSFGFDIPEFLPWPKEDFTRYLVKFTDLYRSLFVFPKPLIAALNGHTIAGGCMLALACDRRLMAMGKGKVSLNEISFGSSVFAGAVAMLRLRVSERNAEEVLWGGALYAPEEACAVGLVDEVVAEHQLAERARSVAHELAAKDGAAFASIKRLLRAPTAEAMAAREPESIREFVELWYSPQTRRQLEQIRIR